MGTTYRKHGRRKRRKKMRAKAAQSISHRKYGKVKFNWNEMYAAKTVTTDTGLIVPWILNRPGANVFDVTAFATSFSDHHTLSQRNVYNTDGAHGAGHQPYLWDQISPDYDQYRVYGAQYKLNIKNVSSRRVVTQDAAAEDLSTHHLYLASAVTQEKFAAFPSALNFDADHASNQPMYVEGRHPEWKRVKLAPGESHTFRGYVDVKRLLKPGAYNNRNEMLSQYPWFSADTTPAQTTTIGDEDQNQPYYGWTGVAATVSNVTENGPADAANVTASYGRAPQACFLYLLASTSEQDVNLTIKMECSLSVKYFVEFKRQDPVYVQS